MSAQVLKLVVMKSQYTRFPLIIPFSSATTTKKVSLPALKKSPKLLKQTKSEQSSYTNI